MKTIQLYTDGSGTVMDLPGGWGAILVYGEYRKELSGAYDNGSNNVMEIAAVLHGLEVIRARSAVIEIYTDSQVVIQWLTDAKTRHAKTTLDIIHAIDNLACDMDWTLRPIKLKGHDGHPENERCHVLANEARLQRVMELTAVSADEEVLI